MTVAILISSIAHVSTKMNKQTRSMTLFIAVLVIFVARDPTLLSSPRFWGEEGLIYFSYARENSWIMALLKPHLGYYSLFANLASVLAAHLLPLKFAPFATTYMALAVQTLPFGVVIWGRSQLWHNYLRKMVAIMLILFAPLSGEIWLNSINSQFYFCLTVLLLFFEPPVRSRGQKYFLYGVVFIACLSSVVCCFLFPIILSKALLQKRNEDIKISLIMLFCTLIQFGIVIHTSPEPDLLIIREVGLNPPGRSTTLTLPVFGYILFVKNICLPLLGSSLTQTITNAIHSMRLGSPLIFSGIGYGLLLLVASLILWLMALTKKNEKYLLIEAYLLLVVLSTIFSRPDKKWVIIDPINVQRYYYIPNIIILLMVYWAGFSAPTKAFSLKKCLVPTLFLGITLFHGIVVYRSSLEKLHFYKETPPKWENEVAKWENNENYILKIWPKGWQVKLNGNK